MTKLILIAAWSAFYKTAWLLRYVVLVAAVTQISLLFSPLPWEVLAVLLAVNFCCLGYLFWLLVDRLFNGWGTYK